MADYFEREGEAATEIGKTLSYNLEMFGENISRSCNTCA